MRLRHALSFFAAAVFVLAAAPLAAQEADLFILKEDSPDPVAPGGTLTYTITVLNNGPDDSEFVSLDDTLPAEVTFTSLSADPAWTCSTPAVGSGGTVSCSIDTLPVGSSFFTLVGTADSGVALGTWISNTAWLGSAATHPTQATTTPTAAPTVGLPPPSSSLSVTKSGAPNPVPAGSDLVYTITVTNEGPDAATGVSLVDNIPPETTYVSSSVPAGWSCTPPAVPGDSFNCSNPSLAVGSEVLTLTVNVTAGPPPGTVLYSSVVVSANNASDPASATAKNVVGGVANYSITKTDSPDPVDPGADLTYTITATNAGPSSVTDATVSDLLPAETTFVSLVEPAGWTCSRPAVGATGPVSCFNPSFAVGSAVFPLVVQVGAAVPGGTVITNTAATSAGPNPAADAAVSDPLPAGSTFVSLAQPAGWTCSTPAVGATGGVSCTKTSFAAGSAVFTLVVEIGDAVPGGTVIVNTATISSATPDSGAGGTTATATTTVQGTQPIVVVPTVDGRGLLVLAALLAAFGAWWLRTAPTRRAP